MRKQFFNTPNSWREWFNCQEKHRIKINKIYSSTSARLDNMAQKQSIKNLPVTKGVTRGQYNSPSNLREIDKKNQVILERLMKLAKTPAVLKTLPVAENTVNQRKYFLKKIENKKIHKENLLLAKRLAKTNSAVNFRKYEREFADSQRYLNIRKRKYY